MAHFIRIPAVLAALALVALAAACGDSDTPEPTATPTPTLEPQPTATATPSPTRLPETFPVTLAGLDFLPLDTFGPVWPCEGPEEYVSNPELSQFAGTPFQMFGATPPVGISLGPNGHSMTSCDGRVWHVAGDFLGAGGAFSVVRVLRPEPWARAEGLTSPRQLSVRTVGSTAVAVAPPSQGVGTLAWYVSEVDDGYVVTRIEFLLMTSAEAAALLELLISFDP